MTTNIERATDILIDWADSEGGLTAIDDDYGGDMTGAAEALADADMIMPELPKPEQYGDRTIWRVDEEGFVYIKPNGWIATVAVGNPYDSPRIAYRHALAIIAAANHAEQEHNDG